jgi:hypothetical protein
MERRRSAVYAGRVVGTLVANFPAVPTHARSWTPARQNERQSFRLAEHEFAGLSVFTEAQITAENSLRARDSASLEGLRSAQDRAAETRALDRVTYHNVMQGNELSFEDQFVETRNSLSCVFDTFVRFSSDQIDQALRCRIPFCTGGAPGRSTTTDKIAEALRTLLQSNGIDATAGRILFSERSGAASWVFDSR